MNNFAKIALVSLLVATQAYASEEKISEPMKKTIAIHLDQNTTTKALLYRANTYFQKLVANGELKASSVGKARVFGDVIDFQTNTDDAVISRQEATLAVYKVGQLMKQANEQYSSKFLLLSTNFFFGDKSLAYVKDPYKGCYNNDFLAEGLENKGFKIVTEDDDPDITISIGINACLSLSEAREFYQKQKNPINNESNISSVPNTATHNNSIIQDGVTMQSLSAQNGTGNAGFALVGVGLLANIIGQNIGGEPDYVRYEITLSGKEKQPITYYALGLSDSKHNPSEPLGVRAFIQVENVLYTDFLLWESDDKKFIDAVSKYPANQEKNLFKSTELALKFKADNDKNTSK